MPEFPTHDCAKPDPREHDGPMWTCPLCGQQWITNRGLTRFGSDGWVISSAHLRERTTRRNLREAYELECMAAAYPWWALAARLRARAEATALRALERRQS